MLVKGNTYKVIFKLFIMSPEEYEKRLELIEHYLFAIAEEQVKIRLRQEAIDNKNEMSRLKQKNIIDFVTWASLALNLLLLTLL